MPLENTTTSFNSGSQYTFVGQTLIYSGSTEDSYGSPRYLFLDDQDREVSLCEEDAILYVTSL